MSTLTVAIEKRIAELNSQLEDARVAYYQHAAPIMTDAEYDAKEHELKSLIKKNPELAKSAPVVSTVGSDLTAGGRVKHAIPMKSIENHYTTDDYAAWYDTQALDGNGVMVEEPKYDGISISAIFVNGKLVRALTRGDGESGEDITAAVRATGNIPVSLPSGKTLEVRGELVMKNSTLAKINAKLAAAGLKTYASTRNLCAGTMKQKDLTNIPERDIQIRPWDVLGKDLPDSRLKRLHLIAKDGFPAPLGVIVTDRATLLATLNTLLANNKISDVNADGVVLKIDSVKASETLGVGSNYANFQICFKPQSAKGETYLREVLWQVGRSGKVTPVGILDPVTLAGAVITRVNLNNISYIREMKLRINSRVLICRSGDVIPVIERVLDGDPE
jgi:DNA ligase (NAD+)